MHDVIFVHRKGGSLMRVIVERQRAWRRRLALRLLSRGLTASAVATRLRMRESAVRNLASAHAVFGSLA